MKRFLFVILSALILFSCQQPTVKTQKVYVYDSAWKLILSTDATVSARDVSMSDIETQVATYNAANDDDQYFLETEEVPIEEAPQATAYIVRDDTYAVMYQATVERTNLVDRRVAWDMTTRNIADPATGNNIPCTLFVDKIPELPEVPVIDPYVAWAYYIVDGNDGSIFYEEHCDNLSYYGDRIYMANMTIQLLNRDTPGANYYLVSGQLYIPPTVSGD